MSLLFLLLAGCSVAGPADPDATAIPTDTLPAPQVFVTSVPPVEDTVRDFLGMWQAEDYEGMYATLSASSQAAYTLEQFTRQYLDVAEQVAYNELKTSFLSAPMSGKEATAAYRVSMNSIVLGELVRETTMRLVMEQGKWKVDWHPTAILPELVDGNYLRMDREVPIRAPIYDRNGKPIAAQEQAVSIGIWADYVDLSDTQGLLGLISSLLPVPTHRVRSMIENSYAGTYLALGEIPVDLDPRRLELLRSYGAVVTSEYSSRLYYDGGIGPHVVGYVSALQEEEVSEFARLGYSPNARVGRKGIEQWGESILAGSPGGALYVFDAEGKPVQQLGAVPSSEGQSITTTLEADFQREAQSALSIFSGAIVVMERDTGRVLAMVSSPGFNPNAYEFENYNYLTEINQIVNNPNSPQFNRATSGQYPLGSVFKIVNIAAALESGRFTKESTYECGYVFEELDGFPRYDWTYEYFQEDGVTRPSGLLTLPQGLIRSCNPWFWHIGLALFDEGLTTAISDMSRAFGFGERTGIEVVEEEAGNIPEPGSRVDAVNLAIGQGDMLVTPLQVARMVAAVGNGGTLYRPQVIEMITSADGTINFEFKPEVQGTLPITEANLFIIQEAMKGVVSSTSPLGTAVRAFQGLDIPVAGKTGTAEVSTGDPHAWFAGYTFANQLDRPDIAIAVIAESAGQGSEIAAPIFRRIVELYFYGKPLRLYRWEANFDVTRSPTSPTTDTPTPQQGLNP